MNGLFKNKERQIGKVVALNISLLVPNRSQPRREFGDSEIKALADSIRENGILQPVCVRRSGVNYEIISGERRTRAAKLCGMTEVPCIVMEADDRQAAILALIENIQRKDLSYFEEAFAIEKLIKFYGLTQEEAAARLGKAQSTIANKLRLLKFTDAERNMLIKGNITERQARALIRVELPAERIKLLSEVLSQRLNIEQTEQLVDEALSGKSTSGTGTEAKTENANLRKIVFPVPRLYINSINKIVKSMKEANINCETTTNKVGDCFEYTIRIHATEI